MAGGISTRRLNGFRYRRLKKVQEELHLAFVGCEYAGLELHGARGPDSFIIGHEVLRASNGECAILPYMLITTGGKTEAVDHLGFAIGLARIKREFCGCPTSLPSYVA